MTLTNDATGVAVTRPTDAEGRYLFDFVDPGVYTHHRGARAASRRVQQTQRPRPAARRRHREPDDVELGGIEETVTVEAPPVAVQFNTEQPRHLTVERQLHRSGAHPRPQSRTTCATLDPTVVVSPATNENRPYHHAYANDYDAGGGTRRANDVLLDGVPLGASYKTAYTPAVDAVEEITISKNSVDAENGHSLGGIISLNMKSGTNQLPRLGLRLLPRPGAERADRSDARARVRAGTTPLRGSELRDVRRHARRPDSEEPDLLLHVLRAVGRQPAAVDRPHRADRARAPRRLQPVAC